jgi:hypothetical protein
MYSEAVYYSNLTVELCIVQWLKQGFYFVNRTKLGERFCVVMYLATSLLTIVEIDVAM